MREKVSHALYDEEQSHLDRPNNSSNISKRVDLNDLLKRVKEQKKKDTTINLFLYAGAALVLLVFILIISI